MHPVSHCQRYITMHTLYLKTATLLEAAKGRFLNIRSRIFHIRGSVLSG